MKDTRDNGSSAWHRSRAYGYLTGLLVGVALFLAALEPAAPLFIRLLVPLPQIDSVPKWSGRVETQGEFALGAKGSTVLPRHFISTEAGQKEFKCGLFGSRYDCPESRQFDGASGDVWYDPLFGALQWRFTVGKGPRAGQVVEMPYSARAANLRERFNYERHVWRLLLSLAPLAIATLCYYRFRKHLRAAKSP